MNCIGFRGGVFSLMLRFRIMMMLKCIGLMLKVDIIGRKIGVVMMISGDMFMNVFRISSMMLIISRMISGLLDIDCIYFSEIWVICR